MSEGVVRGTSGVLKTILPGFVWQPLRAVATAFLTPIRFSFATGHFRSSLLKMAVNRRKQPIPWYTYPMIDLLFQRDFSGRTVLEFGGGQSTQWWASRAQSVYTIEPDKQWYESVKRLLPDNAIIEHVPIDRVTRSINEIEVRLKARGQKYDIIIIDGHLREEVSQIAFDYLNDGGAIILDNSESYGFYDVFESQDCSRVDFFGFAPGVSLRHCTSVIFKSECFLFSPKISIPVIESSRKI